MFWESHWASHSCSPNTSLQPTESLAGGAQMQRQSRPLQGLLSSPNRDLGPMFRRRGVCCDSGSAVCKRSCFLQYPAARAREARRGSGTEAPLGPTPAVNQELAVWCRWQRHRAGTASSSKVLLFSETGEDPEEGWRMHAETTARARQGSPLGGSESSR